MNKVLYQHTDGHYVLMFAGQAKQAAQSTQTIQDFHVAERLCETMNKSYMQDQRTEAKPYTMVYVKTVTTVEPA